MKHSNDVDGYHQCGSQRSRTFNVPSFSEFSSKLTSYFPGTWVLILIKFQTQTSWNENILTIKAGDENLIKSCDQLITSGKWKPCRRLTHWWINYCIKLFLGNVNSRPNSSIDTKIHPANIFLLWRRSGCWLSCKIIKLWGFRLLQSPPRHENVIIKSGNLSKRLWLLQIPKLVSLYFSCGSRGETVEHLEEVNARRTRKPKFIEVAFNMKLHKGWRWREAKLSRRWDFSGTQKTIRVVKSLGCQRKRAQETHQLTSAHKSFHFPPGIAGKNISSWTRVKVFLLVSCHFRLRCSLFPR